MFFPALPQQQDYKGNETSAREMTSKFNRALLDFIRDLAKSFPQVEGFRRAYASTNLMSTLNPPLVQCIFSRYCSKYTDKILIHDDAFFIEKDYSDEMVSVGESMEIVSMIKDIWATLGQPEKDVVWRHMEVLIAISHTIDVDKTI